MDELMIKKYIAEHKWSKFILLRDITQQLYGIHKLYMKEMENYSIIVDVAYSTKDCYLIERFLETIVRRYNRQRRQILSPLIVEDRSHSEILQICQLYNI